ncbi:metal-dependent hydrolase [Candidatus Woesearchaeota archaeon]|nr:metal-dependent hydrolase [Candidatus Woesearchaeota archaeon]
MLSRTHLVFGYLILFSYLLIFNQKITLALFLIVFFASLLADVDIKSSFIGRRTKVVAYVFGHRGFFHTIWAALLLSVIIYELLGRGESVVFFLAYTSHLVLDGFSKKGVKPFYPLKFSMKGGIKVGKGKEKMLFFASLIFLLVLIFFYYN